MQTTNLIHIGVRSLRETKIVAPKTRWLKSGLALLILVFLALAVTGCTAGRLRGDSNGWSPVAAVPLPIDSGSSVNEQGSISPLDNTLTVSNPLVFEIDQVIKIEQEQIRITGIRDNELVVERGINGTRAVSHPGQSVILTLGKQFVIIVTTKQGEIQVMLDGGSEAPEVDDSFSPPGSN